MAHPELTVFDYDHRPLPTLADDFALARRMARLTRLIARALDAEEDGIQDDDDVALLVEAADVAELRVTQAIKRWDDERPAAVVPLPTKRGA